jgi:hypothetical protein
MFAILRLGAEQAVFYGLVVIGVYELLVRWPVTRYERARRDRRAAEKRVRRHQQEQAASAQRERERPIREREAAELEARQQADPDPARRRYYLACKSAEAERDAAVEAAKQADRRYRQLVEEETGRMKGRITEEVMVGSPPKDATQ